MIDLVLRPLADAFLQVGVYVAAMLLLFGWLQHRLGDRLTRFLAARWRTTPLIGALLGVTPGCGGAIVVMPLYVRGTVSFGTVVAALVATMGDASFVLIAADPAMALKVHVLLLAAGVASGYAVDAIGLAPPVRPAVAGSVGAAQALPVRRAAPAGSAPAGLALGDGPADLRGALGLLPAGFWALGLLGLAVGVPVTFRLAPETPLYLWIGVAGTAVAVAVVGLGGLATRVAGRDSAIATPSFADPSAPSGMTDVLRRGAREAAAVTGWVAVAFLLTALLTDGLGLDVARWLTAAGLFGVLAGALVGLVPGCAPQVLLTGLYAAGGLPAATLVANAVSQDGDALFPLLMMDRRAALMASVLTTVPALLLGVGVLLLS